MIRFACSDCNRVISVDERHSGKKGKCPKCGGVVVVPESSTIIEFACGSCGHKIRVPQKYSGRKGSCPKCKRPVVIPSHKTPPSEGAGTFNIVCSMCDRTIRVPETSRGQTVECPECGGYIQTSSDGTLGRSDASAPPGSGEDPYQEETEEYEESEGVDRRIIVGLSAISAVVVVGLVVLAAVLRSSGTRPVERPDGLQVPRQVANADSRPQAVTPDIQPQEPVEAVPLPKPGDVVTNSIGMKLVYIPAGSFMMGSSGSAAQLTREYRSKETDFADEFPQHQVRISKGFWMGQTEVTQGQYESVTNAKPWSGSKYVRENPNNPAVYVRWEDAGEFCRTLSQQTGETYRLPTEAEWEYSCRAGTTTRFSFGDSASFLGDYAWCFSNTNVEEDAHPVGQKKPNPWGLYDMHGNVWEWCSDYYDYGYYSNSPIVDPKGPSSGYYRSLRGGACGFGGINLRCSDRFLWRIVAVNLDRNFDSLVGFRVVCVNPKRTFPEEAPGRPETSVDYFNRGKAYADRSKYDEAISEFDKAIEMDPNNTKAYCNRGLAYHDKGEHEQAILDFEKAIELENKAIETNPTDAEAYCNRGLAYVGKGENDLAILNLNKAIEISPRDASAYLTRGSAHNNAGEFDRAISDFSRTIEIDPRFFKAYVNRGLTYGNKGEYDRAISDFSKAIEINPGDVTAYNNRGSTHSDKGKHDLAISDFSRAIEINPTFFAAYVNRGNAYCRKEQYNTGIADFSKAIELRPRFADAYYLRATAYYYEREYGKALEDALKAQSLGSQIDPRFLLVLFKASGRQR